MAEIDLIEAGREVATAEERVTPTTMLALIARAATDPAVDVAKMEALLKMRRELEVDQARVLFNAAYVRLAGKLPRIKKNGVIEYSDRKGKGARIKYARWEDIDRAIRPLLQSEGFALIFESSPSADGRIVETAILLHEAGHSRSSSFGPLPIDTSGGKNAIQGSGSARSYCKRYAGSDVLNLVFEGEDDDGVSGGAEYIGAEQVKELSDLMRELAVNLDDFCRTLNVEALPDIQQAAYPVAINLLMARKARREGQS